MSSNRKRLNVDKAVLRDGLNMLACGLQPSPEFIQSYYEMVEKRLNSYWLSKVGVEVEVIDEVFGILMSEKVFNAYSRLWVPSKNTSPFSYITTTIDTEMKMLLVKRTDEAQAFVNGIEYLVDNNLAVYFREGHDDET